MNGFGNGEGYGYWRIKVMYGMRGGEGDHMGQVR